MLSASGLSRNAVCRSAGSTQRKTLEQRLSFVQKAKKRYCSEKKHGKSTGERAVVAKQLLQLIEDVLDDACTDPVQMRARLVDIMNAS